MAGSSKRIALLVSCVTINFVTINGQSAMTMQDSELVLRDFLPYRLHNAAEKVSLAFARIYKFQEGLNRPEWRVLAILAQLPKATATGIGAQANMHKTKVSRAVFALEARKWLVRRTDDGDRRIEWLQLTKTGRARFANLSRSARRFEADLMAALGAKASAQLLDALARIEAMHLPGMSR
jgi:DNA-binding MarR family transcriptional regulator